MQIICNDLTEKGLRWRFLCAKYIQPHIAKPVLAVRASPLLEVQNLNNKKMNVLKFIVRKKDDYRSERTDLKNDYKVANKLGFSTETNRIERDISKIGEIIELLEEIAIEVQKERVFTETEISHLQSEVHKITGDGEVMQLFNKLLGVNAGGGS